MDNQNFKQVLATLGETYNRSITKLTAKAYWSALKNYSNEQVEQAVIDYISDPDVSQFWPQPGGLIAKIEGNSKQKEISVTDRALEAWSQILNEIRRVGAYGSLELDDKVALKAAQSIGGWQTICHSTEDALKTWKRKEFISAYQTFVGADNLPSSLAGIGQRNNEKLEAQSQLSSLQGKLNDKR